MSARDPNEDLRKALAAQPEAGPTASPSVPYAKFLVESLRKADGIPDMLLDTVFNKDIKLGNISKRDIPLLKLGFLRAEIMFDNSRPFDSCNYEDEILLSTLPSALHINLTDSVDGFQQKQLTTQTTIRQANVAGGSPPSKSRWSFLKRSPKTEDKT